MAGTLTVDTIQSDSSYASTLNVASKMNFASGMQIGGQDATFGGMRNRVINGDMRIDQRNAGASVSVSTSGVYVLDRWKNRANGGGVFTVQQSSIAPAGFNNSTIYTVTTADSSIAAADNYWIIHEIEGYNVADLEWGTANAKTITISFWVRSSVTGTYTIALSNGTTYDRNYVTTYTINSANTFEYKTITITGDTTGTWGKTNGGGISLVFNLGTGTDYQTTANAWNAGFKHGTSSSTNLIATNGATFYITGVQLEKGSAATAFEYRQYGQELALCQRYYEHTYNQGVAAGTATENGWDWIGSDLPNSTTTGTLQSQGLRFEVTKRTQPSMTVWDALGASGKATRYYIGSGPSNGHTCTTDLITTNSFRVFVAGTTTTTNGAFHWAANAEL
jgi:hypothetical protein